MATQTTNYHLSKPDATDNFSDFRQSYNGNMDIIDQNLGGGGGAGGHTIIDENGTAMTTRSGLQFTGNVEVTDDIVNNKTIVNILNLSNHIYSTTEQEVGLWIDGQSTIYEKTYDLGSNLSCASEVWTDTNIPKGQILHLVNAQLQSSDGTLYIANVNADTNGHIGIYNLASSSVGIRYITLQYTKGTLPPVHYIEYIQSTGSQYIETGVGANATSIRIESAIEFQTSSNDGFVWGGYGNGHYGLADIYNDRTYGKIKFFYGNNLTITINSPTYSADTKYIIDMTADGSEIDCTINGIQQVTAKPQGTYVTPSNICLFRRGNDASYAGRAKMYYFKLYVDDVLVRDMKPALDDNNVACMYDEVSATYFYNAGSGSFVAGPDV